MAKQVKAKVYQNGVTYKVFSAEEGEVLEKVLWVTGEKLTEAKAERLAKEECKVLTEAKKQLGMKKEARVTFLKVLSIERKLTVWAMGYDEFLKHAAPIEE